MHQPARYKLLPHFRFPEFEKDGEWEEVKLGQIGEFVSGGTPDTSKKEYWDGVIQWYTPTEIKEKYLQKSRRAITELGLKNSSAKLLPKSTLLLCTRATIGDVGIALSPCTTNQGFQSIVVNDSNCNEFWYYWIIRHRNELVHKASGSTFPEIGKTKIVKILALKPDKQEQQKIAACLSSLDELIVAEQHGLEALKTHKKGLMQQLFPAEGESLPLLRFQEFMDSGEWEEKQIGDIVDYKNSALALNSLDLQPAGYPVYGADGMIGYIKEYQHDYPYISIIKDGSGAGRLNLCMSKSSIIGTLGCLISKEEEKYTLLWAYYFLHTIDFSSFIKGGGIPHIYFSDYRKIMARTPFKAEQQKIAACLSSLDELIAAKQQKIDALKTHKKGLLQGLFPQILPTA